MDFSSDNLSVNVQLELCSFSLSLCKDIPTLVYVFPSLSTGFLKVMLETCLFACLCNRICLFNS